MSNPEAGGSSYPDPFISIFFIFLSGFILAGLWKMTRISSPPVCRPETGQSRWNRATPELQRPETATLPR